MTSLPSSLVIREIIMNMKDDLITRDALEKLGSLIPSDEEIHSIKEAQQLHPGIPLGAAEQFLLGFIIFTKLLQVTLDDIFSVLANIPGLNFRLKLWLFKLDFNVMIKDICEPFKHLEEGIQDVMTCKTFSTLISLTRIVGNIMNSSEIQVFTPESLLKLTAVKDNSSKKSLLYFIVKSAQENKENVENLSAKFHHFSHVAKHDFDEVERNLKIIADQCKNALGYLKLASHYDKSTKLLVENFLSTSVKEILSFQLVTKVVNESFTDFLLWLGMYDATL